MRLKNDLRILKIQRKIIVKSIFIASILLAILLIILFPNNMWQIDSSMKEDVSSTQLWVASKPEVMNLTKQQLEMLREELKESLHVNY